MHSIRHRANAAIGTRVNFALRNIVAPNRRTRMQPLGSPKVHCCFGKRGRESWPRCTSPRLTRTRTSSLAWHRSSSNLDSSATRRALSPDLRASMLIAGRRGAAVSLLGAASRFCPWRLKSPTFHRGRCARTGEGIHLGACKLPLDRLSRVREHQLTLRVAAEDGAVDGPLRIARTRRLISYTEASE